MGKGGGGYIESVFLAPKDRKGHFFLIDEEGIKQGVDFLAQC